MISKEHFPLVKETIKEFFFSLDADPLIVLEITNEGTLRISLRLEDPGLYIGHGGEGLAALQHLLRVILQRKTGERFFVDLDINNYKERKTEYLRELARETANEVALLKKEKELVPMPAAERRIIHMELAGRQNVVTESRGEGRERRVVVKPRENSLSF